MMRCDLMRCDAMRCDAREREQCSVMGQREAKIKLGRWRER